MKCIDNPSGFSGFFAVGVDRVMAWAAQRGKKSVVAKVATASSCFVMDVLAFGFLATLANRMEGKVGVADFVILVVLVLALGGCIPQPSAALEGGF